MVVGQYEVGCGGLWNFGLGQIQLFAGWFLKSDWFLKSGRLLWFLFGVRHYHNNVLRFKNNGTGWGVN